MILVLLPLYCPPIPLIKTKYYVFYYCPTAAQFLHRTFILLILVMGLVQTRLYTLQRLA